MTRSGFSFCEGICVPICGNGAGDRPRSAPGGTPLQQPAVPTSKANATAKDANGNLSRNLEEMGILR